MTQPWLLLDFDNCQMATEHLAVPSLIARFNELYGTQINSPLTFEEFKKHFHGQALETLCSNLSHHFGIEVDCPTLYEAREWRIMQMMHKTGIQMAPNLIETLTLFKEKGYGFAFVSNNPIQRGLAAMRYATNGQGEQLARFFGTAFFEAGERQKPQPDVYLRAMSQLAISPQQCIAVEDSVTGMTAAVGAGIKTYGFLGFADKPLETEQKLLEQGAISCFKDWKEFPALIFG